MTIYKTQALNNDYLKCRWNEPYVTYGLNRKHFGIEPKGVYAGFVIGPSGLNQRDVVVGPGIIASGIAPGVSGAGYVSGNFDETVGWSIAVQWDAAQGVAKTIAVPPGSGALMHLDLTGMSTEGKRVYFVLDSVWGINQQSTLTIQAVDGPTIDANPSLVVLGYCDVPALGTALSTPNFGYYDPIYPRLTPFATGQRPGLAYPRARLTQTVLHTTDVAQPYELYYMNPQLAGFNMNLPSSFLNQGYIVGFKNVAMQSGNTCRLLPKGADLLEGQSFIDVFPGEIIWLGADGLGSYWQV